MPETEFKKYDTDDDYEIRNARLAKDAIIIEGGDKPLVKLTFVSTSRMDRHSDAWFEATVQDRQSDFAAYLKKNDVVGIRGKFATRKWGDNNEKVSLELVRAEIFPSLELRAAVKERGFVGGSKPAEGGKKGKTAPQKKTTQKREIKQLDDDLDADLDA